MNLTSLARRLASRRNGVRATVSLRGRGFPDADRAIELHSVRDSMGTAAAPLVPASTATKCIRAAVDFPPTARIDTRLTILDWPLSVDDELRATVCAVTTLELANDVPRWSRTA